MKARLKAWLQDRMLRARARSNPWFERLMDWAAARDLSDRTDFAMDADWAILEQKPNRPRVFVWTLLALADCAVLRAALARVDEVSRGEGKVIPSGQNQHLQSLDGGVVSEILVKEGQVVKKGQLLLKVDNTRFVSSLRENQAQYLSLLAKAARLRAITEQTPFEMPAQVI